MIAKLSGVVDSLGTDHAVIDVNGVGYLVFASSRTLARLAQGQPASLLVETHVREDHIHLYGFADAAERDWFRLLMTVQGVGAKVALAILSVLSPDQLTVAIAAQDKAAITRADGVGPKLGVRLVTELKDKVGKIALGAAVAGSVAAAGQMESGGAMADAVSALVNLGYRRSDAFSAVATAARDAGDGVGAGDLIRAGLKILGG